ncbi:MAG: DUF3341 domain-containing protein [Bdellovibrionaceae bacterium]|nr:DUF3341 domain-containing protein [Pseudobdellovibrionaceae bacterium]
MAKAVGGIAGIFLDEASTLAAAHKIREMGFKKFDAISPYPVHGMEEAVGIKRSPIPYVTFIAGLIGLTVAVALTYWTSVVDWPINVGGKPLFSLPAFVPIMFELTVLFAALSSVAAFLYFCGMPKIDPPVIDPDLSSHKFAIFIPENDVGYDYAKLESVLRSLGAAEVKRVAEY